MEESERDSVEDNYEEEVATNNNDSKRELKPIVAKNTYNDLFNLNYAQRKHLNWEFGHSLNDNTR